MRTLSIALAMPLSPLLRWREILSPTQSAEKALKVISLWLKAMPKDWW
jgi:hypothetical protein